MRAKKLFALATVFASLGIVAVSSASATEWLLNGAPIASAISVDSEDVGSLLLQDHGAFTEPDLLCTETDEGTVGPGAADTETVFTVTGCVTDSGECRNVIFKAVDLPWRTELVLVGTAIRDNLKANGKGEPGYETACETFIGTLHDTCKTELWSAGFVENNASGVKFAFDATTEPANCSLGGAKAGLIEGFLLILPLTGILTVS
jgi:hypothetical protein